MLKARNVGSHVRLGFVTSHILRDEEWMLAGKPTVYAAVIYSTHLVADSATNGRAPGWSDPAPTGEANDRDLRWARRPEAHDEGHLRLLSRARNALLDIEDATGSLTSHEQRRLADIETELAALDRAQLAAHASDAQGVWAAIDTLAARVLETLETAGREL